MMFLLYSCSRNIFIGNDDDKANIDSTQSSGVHGAFLLHSPTWGYTLDRGCLSSSDRKQRYAYHVYGRDRRG